MSSNVFILAAALAALQATVLEGQNSLRDPCALLKGAEVQSVAAGAAIGAGVPGTLPLGGKTCVYTWGTGKNAVSGRYSLSVNVSPASQTFPGMSPATIKLGIQRMVTPGEANSSEIAGVGEAAVFQSNSPIRASTTAYAKGMILAVNLEGQGALGRKAQVIALLKAAAGRL